MTLFDITYDDFKREDTTNVITITLYTDDKQPITPNSSHTWKAKVSKEDKYVGEYPVTISGDTIKLSSSNLTRLPNGDYGLELWETYSGSTTIYPSAGVMEFRVHRNANDTLGTVDPTTDINGIIDDLHKAGQNIKVVATNTLSPGSKASVTQSITNGENQLTFNIPQGPKGEQGNVGPAPMLKIGTVTKLGPDQAPTASLSGGNGSYTLNLGIPQGVQGETNATATNVLDLANSVNSRLNGLNTSDRNLARGTSNSWTDYVFATDAQANLNFGSFQTYLDGLEAGDILTCGITLKNTGITAGQVRVQGSGNVTKWNDGSYYGPYYDIASTIPNGTEKTLIYTMQITDAMVKNSFWYLNLRTDNVPKGGTLSYKCFFAKKGNINTTWSPAPEDVDNYTSGRTITLPHSSITVKDDRIIPRIYLPMYITDYLPNTDLDVLATFGEYDNLFVPSATMDTLTNRPTNPDTKASLTGDCFFTSHYAYSGTTVRAFQKLYSCDYNYVFLRSYNSSSSAWSNWFCLTPHA